CPHGFIALTQAGTLVICALAVSAQAARGGIEYDSAWPVRTIPVGTAHSGISTLGGVAFHAPSGSYAVAAADVAPFYIKEPDPELAARLVEMQLQAAAGDPERQAVLAGITADQLDPQQALIPEHKRPEIRTTAAAPLVARCSVDLLSPVTWETVDTHAFEDNEHITCMKTLELESRQTAGGRRAFLCVATAFVLGEDVSSRGKVYIFDIIEVVPLPGRPQTSRKLKLVCQDEVRGAITALGELRGHLAVAVGSKMYVRSFEDNENLLSVAFLDCQTWVRSLVGMKGFLLIADMVNSLWFAGFQEEGPTKVQVLGRDFSNKLPVEAADFLVRGHQMQLLAADAYGQLHFFLYAPHDVHSFKGQKLLRRGEFNLHSRVSAIKRLVGRSADAQQVCLVATAAGSVMAVSMLDERTFKRMHRMNTQLVHGVVPLAGLNPREYRAVPLHLRQYHSPRRTVLDANLLVPMFAHGSVLRQRETAQRVGTTADRVLRDIVSVEQCFAFT
ncbi:mRNA cleavage and polyadenylation factor subunit, partial [Linderina pennispora]